MIPGLWIGTALSTMERLSIASFIRQGHPYHLYVYEDVGNVPTGTVVKDGNEILPASAIFQYRRTKSYAGFANFFRYKLLLDKGGWWVDTDVICLKPFNFEADHVFATEWVHREPYVTSGIIKAPAASRVMAYAWDICQQQNIETLQPGETGPRLMTKAVETFELHSYVQPPHVFCPLGYIEWDKVLEPQVDWTFDKTTCAIHLWNEMWRQGNYDKNSRYHPDCLYEQLQRRYFEV